MISDRATIGTRSGDPDAGRRNCIAATTQTVAAHRYQRGACARASLKGIKLDPEAIRAAFRAGAKWRERHPGETQR